MAKKILAIVLGFAFAPAFIAAEFDSTGLSGSNGQQFVGEPCAVRVYHTNFRFPPEGGKIIQVGNELFFIRTGKAGCANAGMAYTTIVASNSSNNPLMKGSSTYVNPSYTGGTVTPTVQPVPPPAVSVAPPACN